MEGNLEKEGLEHLANIEEDIEEIRERTPTGRRAFLHGMLQGAGAVVGSILALALIGFALSLFGVIPGLSELAHYLQDITSGLHTRV